MAFLVTRYFGQRIFGQLYGYFSWLSASAPASAGSQAG
jgi:hypothetical protein